MERDVLSADASDVEDAAGRQDAQTQDVTADAAVRPDVSLDDTVQTTDGGSEDVTAQDANLDSALDIGLPDIRLPEDVAVECGVPPTVENGNRAFATTSFASNALYSCASGYSINGSATLTCDASGSWGTPPTCDDIDECTSGSVCTALGNTCINTAGSWECACDADYLGSTVAGGNSTCTIEAAFGTLGGRCMFDSDCPENSWCSTVSGFERCSPRVFAGTEHQMDFVFVPSGTFLQGTSGATDIERPYTSTISRAYFVSRTEVTQAQWKAATGGTNPSYFQNTTCTRGNCGWDDNANDSGPVESLTWYAAVAYANWLSLNEGLAACYTLVGCEDPSSGWHGGYPYLCTDATFSGLECAGYRLLTESEWERAARGGTTSTYYWGEEMDAATIGLNAWFGLNAGDRTQSVGVKRANAYGLFDMSGNVSERVWDRGHYDGSSWSAYPIGSTTDYTGPTSGSARGMRGGSFVDNGGVLGSAARRSEDPEYQIGSLGFRLARTAN